MKLVLLYSVFLNINYFCDSRSADNLKVRIDDGQIVGRYMTTISGKGIRSFLGIPYAAPPIGELRFRAPKEPVSWFDDILVAHNEPPMCSQTNIFDRGEKRDFGQEDCLYLNVYTPNVCIVFI